MSALLNWLGPDLLGPDLLNLDLTPVTALLLAAALLLALGFEFVNGFHDTANAVATVIYTHSLQPGWAVAWSGLWNLIGVLVSSGVVAYSIVALLPVELVLNVDSAAGFAMVFALLVSAILWNLGTWYLGLPASSSHTLIGSILGVGLANAVLTSGLEDWSQGINWAKVEEVLLSLLTSPLLGFLGAGLLLLLAQTLLPQPELYQPPKDEPPPFWIRALLILTCTGVSFAHGSNDGQKGMGLIMLILVGLLPGAFALNLALSPADLNQMANSLQPPVSLEPIATATDLSQSRRDLTAFLASPAPQPAPLLALSQVQHQISQTLSAPTGLAQLARSEKLALRDDLYLMTASLTRLEQLGELPPGLDHQTVIAYQQSLRQLTQFIPVWVKVAVALALGLGTMVGWQRIVTTVGEKIGQDHLSYGQGAAAELVAMGTILAADRWGLPVSTTHVLSSGVAGTMVANRSGLQGSTIRSILLAWVLTLPVCVGLSGGIFAICLWVLL